MQLPYLGWCETFPHPSGMGWLLRWLLPWFAKRRVRGRGGDGRCV
jgi:hypothetical protein